MAVSPDKRYVVTVNAGYGTFESQYQQSLAVLDTKTGTVADFPEERTEARRAKQTLYSGLAFSRDGSHLYASMGSVTDPTGRERGRHRKRHHRLQLHVPERSPRTGLSSCPSSNSMPTTRRA